MVTPHKVASSNPNWDEFSLVGKKISLAVLAARLGPLGHGPGCGSFSAAR